MLEYPFEAIVAAIVTISGIAAFLLKRVSAVTGTIIKRPEQIIVKFGQTIIVHEWLWWPPGWKKLLISVDDKGDPQVTYL